MEKPRFLGGAADQSVPRSQQQRDLEAQFLKNHAMLMRRELDSDTRVMLLAEQVRLLFVRVSSVL